MFAVPLHQYICLLAGLEYVSLLCLGIRKHCVIEGLLIDHAVIIWFPASIWISLFLLRRCQSTEPIRATMTSNGSLPNHSPILYDLVQQKAPDARTALNDFVVLIAFAHTWLAFLHRFHLVTASDRNISCQSQDNPDNAVSITWAAMALVAFASSLLVLAFGHCLLAFGIKKDFEHWGYFLYLFRIISFLFSTWSLLLWIIDLFEGRIEILRT